MSAQLGWARVRDDSGLWARVRDDLGISRKTPISPQRQPLDIKCRTKCREVQFRHFLIELLRQEVNVVLVGLGGGVRGSTLKPE